MMKNEKIETYALATQGLARGVYREFVEPQITAERAWAVLVAGIAIYEATAPENHLLSEGIDRMIDKHPIATRTAIGYTALHLCNLLPEKLDLFHQLTRFRSSF